MLTFNLKKECFEKIKLGEKTHEYREVKPYWTKRLYYFDNPYREYNCGLLRKCQYEECIFVCGYAKKDDKDKRLKAKVISITSNVNGMYTDLRINKPVYDIEFELLEE